MTLISKIKYIEKLGPEVLYSFLQEKRMCGNDYCLHQPRPPFPEDKNTIHGPFSFSISERDHGQMWHEYRRNGTHYNSCFRCGYKYHFFELSRLKRIEKVMEDEKNATKHTNTLCEIA